MSIGQSSVGAIRKFNRYYTNILGLLEQHMLGSEFSLSEIRVLFEIGYIENCTSKKLIHELNIDSGYLSRIIKRFEKLGLIYRQQSTEDGRLYYLFLTSKGKEMMATLNDISDNQIQSLVACLQEQEQRKLVEAMQVIESTLSGKPSLSTERICFRSMLMPGDVGRLIYLHGRLYADECGYNHAFEGYVCKTFHEFFQNYSPEKDRFWFAEADGQMMGAIAIVGHSETEAQLRWFILQPDFRGMGVGNKLLNKALQYCRDKGYRTVFLYTTEDQKTAIKMYLKAGFKKVQESENNMWGKSLIELCYQLDLQTCPKVG